MSEWQQDNIDSAHDFKRVVWDVIKTQCGGGVLHSCENNVSKVAELLDVSCGIDYLQELSCGLRGIAVRIQWVDLEDYDTFTIRASRPSGSETEMNKRLQDDRGCIKPYLTVQAYIKKPRGVGDLVKVFVCKTSELYASVKAEKYTTRMNPVDGVKFNVVEVSDIAGCWAYRADS
jgi:hypothetical protein